MGHLRSRYCFLQFFIVSCYIPTRILSLSLSLSRSFMGSCNFKSIRQVGNLFETGREGGGGERERAAPLEVERVFLIENCCHEEKA